MAMTQKESALIRYSNGPRSIFAGVSGGSQKETRVRSDRRIHGMMRMIM